MKLGVLAGRCYYNHAQRDMLDPAAHSLNTPKHYTSFLVKEAENSPSTGVSFLLSKSCAGAIISSVFFSYSL